MSEDKPHQFTSSPQQWNKLKPLAKHMRHEPTPAEAALWQLIRNRQINGVKFRRQHSIEGFIADFVSIEHKLIIEVDGEIHEQADQQAYDLQRQEFLETQGFQIMRFTNDDVLQSPAHVIEQIRLHLNQSDHGL